jgi:hypothetical protein
MRKSNEQSLADDFDVLMTKLEGFADHFEHLATTSEQRKLVADFNASVREFSKEFLPRLESADIALAPEPELAEWLKETGHESWESLFQEMREEDALRRGEDVHSVRQKEFKSLLDGKAEARTAEASDENEIER